MLDGKILRILENLPDKLKEYETIAIPIDIETFKLCKKLGGQVLFENEPSKNHSGIFHLVKYNGNLYIARTDDYIKIQ